MSLEFGVKNTKKVRGWRMEVVASNLIQLRQRGK